MLSEGFFYRFLYFLSSKFKVGFGFNHGGFSWFTIGDMSSQLISECLKCDFIRSPKDRIDLGCLSYILSYKGLNTQSWEW